MILVSLWAALIKHSKTCLTVRYFLSRVHCLWASSYTYLSCIVHIVHCSIYTYIQTHLNSLFQELHMRSVEQSDHVCIGVTHCTVKDLTISVHVMCIHTCTHLHIHLHTQIHTDRQIYTHIHTHSCSVHLHKYILYEHKHIRGPKDTVHWLHCISAMERAEPASR